jgi:hypothetical protein
VRNCPKRCASSSSTINGAATISVGQCSTADSRVLRARCALICRDARAWRERSSG